MVFYLSFSLLSSEPHFFILLLKERFLFFYLPLVSPQFLLKVENFLLSFLDGVFLGSHLFGGGLLVGLSLSYTYRYSLDLRLTHLTIFISERERLAIYLLFIICARIHFKKRITILIALSWASASLHA